MSLLLGRYIVYRIFNPEPGSVTNQVLAKFGRKKLIKYLSEGKLYHVHSLCWTLLKMEYLLSMY